ncbi:hypothetical protein AAVH_14042 [Aphelenchoides avenae]|nr:hypothetical protein AAVH_14042 [Aphelenchus avenae]
MPPKEKPRQAVAGGKGEEGNGVASKDAGQPEAEVMDTGAAAAQEDKIADLEQQLQEAHHKVQQLEQSNAELKQQLREADGNLHKMKESKDKLEKLLEAQLKKQDGETTGTSKPEEVEVTPEVKVDDSRSRKGFKRSDSSVGSKTSFSGASKRPSTKASASLPRTPPPTGSSEYRLARALEMIARNQSLPNLPPPQHFSGDRRKDKIGLSEFLEMYERRVVNCSEDDKVSLLSEYLIGEARRAYKSVMSANASLSFRGLCRELKGMMIDSSRTSKLLKMKRFDDLKIHLGQTYLSFITLIESQAAEAYGDADEWTLDQVKTKVLLSNLRERELVMHVETDLRKLKDDELQFPVVKSLAITYERTDVSVNKWRSQGSKSYRRDFCGNDQQLNDQLSQSDAARRQR